MIFKQCSSFLLYISILKLKDSILIEIKNIVDHRTTWRLGVQTFRVVENPFIIFGSQKT